jgi:hypothetical protein
MMRIRRIAKLEDRRERIAAHPPTDLELAHATLGLLARSCLFPAVAEEVLSILDASASPADAVLIDQLRGIAREAQREATHHECAH